jgi:hypothetical protein
MRKEPVLAASAPSILKANYVNVSLEQIARALNGKIRNGQVIAAGPGHSPQDESLSVTLSDTAEGGFVVKSFAEDDWRACKDYVLEKLGIPKFQPRHRHHSSDDLAKLIRETLGSQTREPKSKPVAIYDYTDASGKLLLYQVCRYEPKRFGHRQPDGHGGWIYKATHRRVLYRWPELLQYPDATALVTEGEKDADNVAALGIYATTVASGKWTDDCVQALAGRDCWILEDNDDTGRKKALEAAKLLHSVANSVKLIRLPGLAEGQDVSDWLDAGHTRQDLEDVCYLTPDWEPEPASSSSTLRLESPSPPRSEVSSPSKAEEKPKQRTILKYRRHRDANSSVPKYLVKNLLPETGVGLLPGQSGTYKSFIGIKLAGAVGTRQPFAGYDIKRQGAALIFASEGAGELPIRLEALSEAEHGGQVLPVYYCDAAVRLLDKNSVASVIATAKAADEESQQNDKLPLALILFDTIIGAAAFAKSGDENDAAVGQKLMAALSEISRATGTFVLGIDHFGKAVETGTRGTSAKEAAADVVLALLAEKALSGEVTAPRLCIRKRRGGPAGVEHPFTVKSVRLGQDDDGEEVTSLVIEFTAAVPPPADDEGGKWTPSLRLLRKILMTLLATAGEQVQPYSDGPAVQAVKTEFVRAEFYKQFSSDKADSKRKAFQRATNSAQGRELIGIREISGCEWLWLVKGQPQ